MPTVRLCFTFQSTEEDGPMIRMHASESDKALVDIYLKAKGGGIALRSNAEDR